MNRRQVRDAMDKSFAPLLFAPRQQAEVFSIVKGEKQVKKKLSVGFALALALALIAVTALAVITIQETGRLMAQTQQENGNFGDWPVEKKATVVSELVAEGYIKETPELTQMSAGMLAEGDAERIADNAVAALTGEDAKDASFLSIMQAAWGPFEGWSYEQQAWYSQVMTDVGAETEGKTCYVEPKGPVTDQEAVRIARNALAKGYGVDESVLDGYRVTTSFQIPEFAEPGDTQAYWYVCFDSWNTGMTEDEIPFSTCDLFIHPDTGELLESVEDRLSRRAAYETLMSAPVAEAIKAFDQSSGEEKTFEHWSLENKARWTQKIAPMVNAYLAEHSMDEELPFWVNTMAAAFYEYGLPDARAISQERALSLARDALRTAFDLSDEEIVLLTNSGNPYYTCVFYDVTDAAHPLWKFLFQMPTVYGHDEDMVARVKEIYGTSDYNLLYKVELNAYTGETVRTLTMPTYPNSQEDTDLLEGYKNLY